MSQNKNYVMSLVWIIALIIALLAAFWQPTQAQDNPITVCHDTTYPTLRFEFHNLPASWFVYDSGAVWGYWAGGIQVVDGVLIADALVEDTDGYLAGTATVLDYDNDQTAVGDALTPPCATITPQHTENAANGQVEPFQGQPVSNPIVSTGRTCVIQYPKIILVCNG